MTAARGPMRKLTRFLGTHSIVWTQKGVAMKTKPLNLFDPFPELETDRLRLRKLLQDDLHDVYNYASNPEVSQYMLWDTHQSIQDTQQFFNIAFEKYKKGELAPFAIEYKSTGRVIGTIDFVWWERENATAELGYVLTPSYWGQGLIPEAAQKLAAFGFQHMNLFRIEARCYADNAKSIRVMEKLGMSREGVMRGRLQVKGSRRDVTLYALLRSEWEKTDSPN